MELNVNQTYYMKNRESIIERSKQNYKKRKEREPDFWKKRPPLTDEEKEQDIEQMNRIIRHIKEQQRKDEESWKIKDKKKYHF
jgi:hypothetical protein